MLKRPFVYYYGAKFRLRKKYPQPLYDTIIEPFAGFAGYSTLYPDYKVKLFDCNPDVYDAWDFLLNVTEHEFQSLPVGWEHIDDIRVSGAAKKYLRWVCNSATAGPCNKMTTFARKFWTEKTRFQLSQQLQQIRRGKQHGGLVSG